MDSLVNQLARELSDAIAAAVRGGATMVQLRLKNIDPRELVQVLVEILKKLTDRQKQLLREYAATEDGNALPQRKGFLDKLKDVFQAG